MLSRRQGKNVPEDQQQEQEYSGQNTPVCDVNMHAGDKGQHQTRKTQAAVGSHP
jgi:hypothetical protein